jgi:inner membrane protein
MTAALSPDLDVLIRSAADPLMNLQYHRHFTHALIFTPIGAAIIAFIWWLLLKRKEPYKALWGYCFFGIFTHGILDSMTNYGTHLFWPFTNARESWSIISIIDPIFTLTLLALLITTLVRKQRRFVVIGAVFAAMYLSFGYAQKERATQAMMSLAMERGHLVLYYEVKPSLGNLFVWRVQYEAGGRYYIDAVRISLSGKVNYFAGNSVAVLDTKNYALNPSSVMANDIERFRFFSDGWLAALPEDPNMIGDMRFGLLPNDTHPLWGIRIDPTTPDTHAEFVNLRTRRDGDLGMLLDMIFKKY